MANFKLYLLILIAALYLNACDEQRIFERDIDFNQQEWQSTDTLEFAVNIENQTPVNLYVNLRHRFDFNWRNVWLNLGIYFPNDSLYEMPINIPLSQPDGQWFGDCSGDICRLQFPLDQYTNYAFSDTGEFIIRLSHEMREDPLLEIISAGIRLEHYNPTE